MCPVNALSCWHQLWASWVPGDNGTSSQMFSQPVHSLDLVQGTHAGKEGRGTKAVSIHAVPVTICFRCLARPQRLCLFDLDICTEQEMVVSRQRKTKPAHVVGGWRKAWPHPGHPWLCCSLWMMATRFTELWCLNKPELFRNQILPSKVVQDEGLHCLSSCVLVAWIKIQE